MKKIDISSDLTTLAYNSIREYILLGRLDDMSRLTGDFLSNKLGISMSPIREALNRLEAEGLVRIEPRKGAFLRRLTRLEINELYDTREALEAHVVRTASITPALLGELRQSLKQQRMLVKANDKPHYIQEDVIFHSLLAQSSGNAYLCTVLNNIQNQIWLSRRSTYDLSGATAPDYHEDIVNALDRGAREEAERAMRAHIQTVRHRLLQFMDDQRPAGENSSERALAAICQTMRLHHA